MILLRLIAYWLCVLLPKRKHAILYGWPDAEDSVIALERGLSISQGIERIVILCSNPMKPLPWQAGPKTKCLKKNSIAGLMAFAQARHLFFTHPCFLRKFPPTMISVNVWHGMPIKRIGWMLERNRGIGSSHALATSPFWAGIMDRSMRPRNPTLTTGLPRNDRLFSDRAEVLSKLGLSTDQRLIVWLPTYRKSVRGELRLDGIEAGNVFELPGAVPETINSALAAQNVVMLVKPHPMAPFDRSDEWSHLRVVDDHWLKDRCLSLYETLGASDILISDVSSVVIDYLLLDRPILHALPDLEEYRESRGFSMEPIEDYFCGAVVTNQTELLASINLELTNSDPHAGQRRKMRDLSHAHQDGKSTERLLCSVGL